MHYIATHLLAVSYLLLETAAFSSFVAVSGRLVCPVQRNFTATIRLMEEDSAVHDFGAQYTRRANEFTGAYSAVQFYASARLSDGWFDYAVEPFVQILHNCINQVAKDEDDDEEETSICIALPSVSASQELFHLGDVDLTSTWTKLPQGAQQEECSARYGSLVFATRGSRIVLLGGDA